ncbi:MAG: hypothetical protein IJH12_07775 [Clostridia bacterium]|nr:hypothetical protein [Clostridia bacterium]
MLIKFLNFGAKNSKYLTINITDLNDTQKERLRGAIKFFAGDRNNVAVRINNGGSYVMSGGIYVNDEILNEFRQIVGFDNVKIGTEAKI